MHSVVTSIEVQTSSENHDLGFLPGIFAVQPLKDITEQEFLTVLAVLHKHKPVFNNLMGPGAREIPLTEHGNQRNTDLPKRLIKHKQLCLAGRPTHTEPCSPAQAPGLFLLARDPKACGLFAQPAGTSRDGAPGCWQARDCSGCSGKSGISYFL